MAILKYTTADGQTVKLNSYKVQNLVPVQEKGDNPNAVMSQKAVSDEVNQIGLEIDEVNGTITAVKATADQAAADITALNTAVAAKASASDLSAEIARATAAEEATAADITALTATVGTKANQSEVDNIKSDITEMQNTLGECASSDSLGELENVVSTKANKSALEAEVTRATEKEGELQTAIGTKANASDVYVKTEIDGIIEAANTAINSKLPIDSFNEWSETVATKDEVNAKAASSDLTAEVSRATAKETELSTTLGTKAASADLTAETNRAKAVEEDLDERLVELEDAEFVDAGEY